MIIGESFEQPHRKSTIQGRLDPISCSASAANTPSPTTSSLSKDVFSFQKETLPISPPATRKISDTRPISSHRELKPVRVPPGNHATSPEDDIDVVMKTKRSGSTHDSITMPTVPTQRRYSVQVPFPGSPGSPKSPSPKSTSPKSTSPKSTSPIEKFLPKKHERSISTIDQRFETSAQFIESVRKDLEHR